jgi:hypothetical protein
MRDRNLENRSVSRRIEPDPDGETACRTKRDPASPLALDDATALRYGSSTRGLIALSPEEQDAMAAAVARAEANSQRRSDD